MTLSLMSSNCLLSISFLSPVANQILLCFFQNSSLPIFDVMMMMIFLKSISLPLASLSCPSSRICNRIFNTSVAAFSTSSNKSTQYGFLLIASVRFPPSSYHTYPAGEPINLDTEYFSMNSDISILIIAVSSPK